MTPSQKTPLKNHPLQELDAKLGRQDTIFVLDVHYGTIYKWFAHLNGKKNSRRPGNGIRMLAAIYLFLLKKGWSIEQLKDVVSSITGKEQPLTKVEKEVKDPL